MNLQHLAFCPPGTPFFDTLGTSASAQADYPAATRPLDEGWQRNIGPDWAMVTPPDARLPVQGWKIHVSAGLDNAEKILDVTWNYAVERQVAFKFIRGSQVLARRNGKYGDRSGSGKFITIYPRDEAHLEAVLHELGDLLEGEHGPYILSDLRWRGGPLYVRYGAFAAMTKRVDGGRVIHCIVDPNGQLVPDQRGYGFRPPEWVTLPDFLQESLTARNAGTLRDFPYAVEKAIHFSNGGGIYRGIDTRTGNRVLMREARPLAGVDSNGGDALTRLQREEEILKILTGVPHVPQLIDYRIGHEHYFLIREYVEGDSLAAEVARRQPLYGEGTAQETLDYTQWVLDLLDRIEEGVEALHSRGVIFGDLHPGNIIIRPDDTVAFIDFETASTDPRTRQFQGAPGFVVPPDYSGKAVDRYMLGCLRIALFVPLSGMLPWGSEKAEGLIELIRSYFPVPADFGTKVLNDLGLTPATTPATGTFHPSSATAPQEIADGILALATPERTDRLFPGDAAQFFTPEGGTAFAHGAAGILWALAETGAQVPEQHIDWLERAAFRLEDPAPGFYNGLSGIAFALDRLGRTGTALELFERVTDRGLDLPGDDLYSGLAGIGLTHLHLACATADRAHIDQAAAIAERIIDRSAALREGKTLPGLMRGPSGGALLLLRLHEETADLGYLDAAQQLLHSDLHALGWSSEGTWADGALGRRNGIAVGASGTGMVLHNFLTHRFDAQLAQARDTIKDKASRDLSRTVGLFQGQAGTILTLLSLGEEPDSPVLHKYLKSIALHAVGHEGKATFLGYENLRISTDLVSGAAGVLLVLETMATDRCPGLPFL